MGAMYYYAMEPLVVSCGGWPERSCCFMSVGGLLSHWLLIRAAHGELLRLSRARLSSLRRTSTAPMAKKARAPKMEKVIAKARVVLLDFLFPDDGDEEPESEEATGRAPARDG